MKIKEITDEESVQENIEAFCLEVGSRFEKYSIEAVNDMMHYKALEGNDGKNIADLGCGDGAATKEFYRLGMNVTGVDVNSEKLSNIECGPVLKCMSALEYLRGQEQIYNVFAHHSLEHMSNVKDILREISIKMRPGSLYYAVVPADDYLHSVHHVVFEHPFELIPSSIIGSEFKILRCEKRERWGEMEFICVAKKI